MAGNATIGSLKVDLGLNSAQFTSGIKEAQGVLGKFGVQLTFSLNGIVDQLGRLAAAFPGAIKGAIDHADALSKSAQKAGVTVEALSRLEYAAKFSELSLEDVTGSLDKLSKQMASAAQNAKGPAAAAFAALGIKVKDSAGNLRSSDQVFADIADRFAKLPDGATKTALAIALFGKAGAQLIPLLNEGSAGLKKYADESDRLGETISGKTASAANRFNDTITKIGSIMDGVVNKVMEAVLPALQSLADQLASPEFAKAAAQLATWIVSAMTTVIQWVTAAVNAVTGLITKVQSAYAYATGGPSSRSSEQLNKDADEYRTMLFKGTTSDPEATQKALIDTEREIENRRMAQMHPETLSTGQDNFDFNAAMAGQTGWGGSGGNTASPGTIDLGKYLSPLKAAKVETKDMGDSLSKLTEQFQTLNSTADDFASTFIGDMKQGKTWVDSLADAFGNLGDQITQMATNQAIQGFLSAIIGGLTNSGPGFSYGAGVMSDPWANMRLPGHAAGIPSAPRGLAWVGEQGPELMNFHGGESVIDARSSAAMGGGSTSITVNAPNSTRESVNALQQWVSSGGFAAEVRNVVNRPHRSN